MENTLRLIRPPEENGNKTYTPSMTLQTFPRVVMRDNVRYSFELVGNIIIVRPSVERQGLEDIMSRSSLRSNFDSVTGTYRFKVKLFNGLPEISELIHDLCVSTMFPEAAGVKYGISHLKPEGVYPAKIGLFSPDYVVELNSIMHIVELKSTTTVVRDLDDIPLLTQLSLKVSQSKMATISPYLNRRNIYHNFIVSSSSICSSVVVPPDVLSDLAILMKIGGLMKANLQSTHDRNASAIKDTMIRMHMERIQVHDNANKTKISQTDLNDWHELFQNMDYREELLTLSKNLLMKTISDGFNKVKDIDEYTEWMKANQLLPKRVHKTKNPCRFPFSHLKRYDLNDEATILNYDLPEQNLNVEITGMEQLFIDSFDYARRAENQEYFKIDPQSLAVRSFETLLEEADLKNDRLAYRNKHHRVTLYYNEQTKISLAERGVMTKANNMLDHPAVIAKKADNKKFFSFDVNTKDIDTFIQTAGEDLTKKYKDLELPAYLLKLREYSDEVNGVNSATTDQDGAAMFTKWYTSTKLYNILAFQAAVARELVMSLMQFAKEDQFVFKKVPNYNAFMLIKAIGSDHNINYSIFVPRGELLSDYGQPFTSFNEGAFGYYTEFESIGKHKLNNMMCIDRKVKVLLALWVDKYRVDWVMNKNSDWARATTEWKESVKMTLFNVLCLIEQKSDTGDTIQWFRYMYMEIIKGDITDKPNPVKVFSKITSLLRSRLCAYICQKIRGICMYYEDRANVARFMERTRENDDDDAHDSLINLKNAVTDGMIPTGDVLINLFYTGVMRDKDDSDKVAANTLLFIKLAEGQIKMLKINQYFNCNARRLKKDGSIDFDNMVQGEADLKYCLLSGIVTRNHLDKVHDNDWENKFWDDFSEMSITKTWDHYSTTKASAVRHTPTSRTTDEDFSKANTNIKAMEAIWHQVSSKEDTMNPRVFEEIYILLADVQAHNIYCNTFLKNQIYGIRAITIFEILARILISCVETIFSIPSTYLEEEVMTKPKLKQQLASNHYIKVNAIKVKLSLRSDVTINGNHDCKSWSPGFCLKSMIACAVGVIPREALSFCTKVINLFGDRIVSIPTSVIDRMANSSDEIRSYSPAMNVFVDEFKGLVPQDQWDKNSVFNEKLAYDQSEGMRQSETRLQDGPLLVEKDGVFLKQNIGFPEGSLGFTSSYVHAACLKLQNKLQKVCFQTLLRHYSLDRVISPLVTTSLATSDDSMCSYSAAFKANENYQEQTKEVLSKVHEIVPADFGSRPDMANNEYSPRGNIKRLVVYFICLCSKMKVLCNKLWGSADSEPKSTSEVGSDVSEFNSSYKLKGNLLLATIKDAVNSVCPNVLITKSSMIDNMKGTLQSLQQTGGSLFLCGVAQEAQWYMNYIFNGYTLSELFGTYAALLYEKPHSALGFYPLTAPNMVGLFGLDYDDYCHMVYNDRDNKWSKTAYALYGSGSVEIQKEGNMTVDIRLLVIAKGTRYENMIKRLGNLNAYDNIVNDKPEVLYRTVIGSKLDIMVKLVAQFKSPGVRNSLYYTSVDKLLVAGVVGLFGKIILAKLKEKGKIIKKRVSIIEYISQLETHLRMPKEIVTSLHPTNEAFDMAKSLSRKHLTFRYMEQKSRNNRTNKLSVVTTGAVSPISLFDLFRGYYWHDRSLYNITDLEAAMKAWRTVIPWLRNDYKATLLASPFYSIDDTILDADTITNDTPGGHVRDHISLANFVRGRTAPHKVLELYGPSKKTTNYQDMILGMIIWRSRTGMRFGDLTKGPIVTPLTSLTSMVSATLFLRAPHMSLISRNIYDETITRLAKMPLEWDNKTDANYLRLRTMSYKQRIFSLIHLYIVRYHSRIEKNKRLIEDFELKMKAANDGYAEVFAQEKVNNPSITTMQQAQRALAAFPTPQYPLLDNMSDLTHFFDIVTSSAMGSYGYYSLARKFVENKFVGEGTYVLMSGPIRITIQLFDNHITRIDISQGKTGLNLITSWDLIVKTGAIWDAIRPLMKFLKFDKKEQSEYSYTPVIGDTPSSYMNIVTGTASIREARYSVPLFFRAGVPLLYTTALSNKLGLKMLDGNKVLAIVIEPRSNRVLNTANSDYNSLVEGTHYGIVLWWSSDSTQVTFANEISNVVTTDSTGADLPAPTLHWLRHIPYPYADCEALLEKCVTNKTQLNSWAKRTLSERFGALYSKTMTAITPIKEKGMEIIVDTVDEDVVGVSYQLATNENIFGDFSDMFEVVEDDLDMGMLEDQDIGSEDINGGMDEAFNLGDSDFTLNDLLPDMESQVYLKDPAVDKMWNFWDDLFQTTIRDNNSVALWRDILFGRHKLFAPRFSKEDDILRTIYKIFEHGKKDPPEFFADPAGIVVETVDDLSGFDDEIDDTIID